MSEIQAGIQADLPENIRPAPDGYYFDERAAAAAVRFFERLLVHVKGRWAGKPFKLMRWQSVQIIQPLFGWKRPDGLRRYRTAYIEIPRKNGKSNLAAGIALLLLFLDSEYSAEIYGAAADKDQAAIVFDLAKAMRGASPELAKRSEAFKRSIVVPSTMSSYKVLSADAFTKHGLNAHGIIFDELHAQPTRELWDVLTTSTGARTQPLTVAITTAGFDKNSICYEQHEYADKVLRGVIDDPSFFAYIAAADKDADWTDPKIWAQANPGLGEMVTLDYMQEQARKAINSPAYQNTFRRLHLNQWTQQDERWLDLTAWDECGDPFDPALLEGAECYAGLDLSSSSDLAALVLDFPAEAGEEDDEGNPVERHAWIPFFWIPADNMVERALKDRVPYDAWARDGLIQTTEGNVIDYGFIVKAIDELGQRFNIREIAFDRWGAFQISQQLTAMGFELVGFGQGFVSMSSPTKELMRLVLSKRLQHGGHPVLRWMADNMVVSTDPAGNVKPNKQKSREKIDGMVAGIMALDRAIRHESAKKSKYEDEDIREL